MSDLFKLTDQQQAVVTNLYAPAFVAAGAGSGKTRVIMACFVQALNNGVGMDEILAITFTEKAAGEMARRIRSQLAELSMKDARRDIERSQINTIHGFCARLVRRHALRLGIDPQFGVTDQAEADILKQETFERCLEKMVASDGDAIMELKLTVDDLFNKISDLYETLRSRGMPEPTFEIPKRRLQMHADALLEAIDDARFVIGGSGCNAPAALEKMQTLEAIARDSGLEQRAGEIRECKPNKSGTAEVKDAIGVVQARTKRLLSAIASKDKIPTLKLIRHLLESFSAEYARAKQERGWLDFEDLQLQALKLLKEHPGVRDTVAASYKLIMVDEFQDTNRLQCDILAEISNGNLVTVGDRNQSIYRFRHADVDLFGHRQESALREKSFFPIQDNFRSQPEILDFVDFLFKRKEMLGRHFMELVSKADLDDHSEDFRVELIVIDRAQRQEKKPKAADAARAEAALVARRLSVLFAGDYKYGDAAILLRRKTYGEEYREALDRAGIPNYLAIGQDYYQKMELGDALSLLRLLVNPLDDLALLGVLRSAVVGVSDDTLMQLRLLAGKGTSAAGPPPLWDTVASPAAREHLTDQQDAERLSVFARDLENMRLRARRQSLAATVNDILDYHDYAAAVAVADRGKLAYANLLKLQGLASEFESSWGRDLPAFVRFLHNQRQSEAEEGDAPTEEEETGAVRILTVHSAKGLEFPLVVWGDTGSALKPWQQLVICGEDGRAGLRYRELEASDADELFDYTELFEEETARSLDEEKRIAYVAMTRAKRHLIIAGGINLEKDDAGFEAFEPMAWLRAALPVDRFHTDQLEAQSEAEPESGATAAPEVHAVVEARSGLAVGLTLCLDPLTVEPEVASAARKAVEPLPAVKVDISKVPEAASFLVPSISPTALDTWRHCPQRFYLESVAGLRGLLKVDGVDDGDGVSATAGAPSAGAAATAANYWGGALDYLQMGSLIHRILEISSLPFDSSAAGELLDETAAETLGQQVQLTPEDRQHARRLLNNFGRTDIAAEMATAFQQGRLERELSFATQVGRTIMGGKIDALAQTGDNEFLIVDYKTGSAGDAESAAAAADRYRLQMAAYALAAARLHPDSAIDVALVFLADEAEGHRVHFDPGAQESLESLIAGELDRMAAGHFPPLPGFDQYLCPGCVGNASRAKICPTAARNSPRGNSR